jgi:hypothetical protein
MATSKHLELKKINAALKELNDISKGEYEPQRELEDLLLDPSPISALRIQRITGIALKRPFARKGPAAPYSATSALRSWPWADGTPEQQANDALKEFAILNQLRMPGPWHEPKLGAGTADGSAAITWEEFKKDADHERGLFKILALYVDDKLKGRDGKSFREYLEAKESRRFEAGLDLAVLLFDAAVTAPVATLLGVPSVAVGVALVGIQYGYRRATDTSVERLGDMDS